MKPKISIFLPCYNSEEVFKKVFWTSVKNFSESVEIILYDNGGNGNLCLKYIPENLLDLKVCGDGKNIGLNAALNECAKVATGEWFYLPHTDMHLMPGWDTALLEAVKNQVPWNILLCSRSIEKHSHIKEQLLMDFGTDLDSFKEKELYDFFKSYNDKSIVTGKRMPFFLHRKLWEKMGGVDERYFSYCTDDDLIQEAYDCGVRKFWMVYNSCVYHLSGHSNKQQSVDRDSMEPYEYFIKKWKERGYLDAHHPGQWHPQLIPDGIKIK